MSEYIVTEFDLASTEWIGEYEEIVRCKDCIRYEGDCDWNSPDLEEPDGFCKWGDRRKS